MIELGQHASFIIGAYAGVTLGVLALIGWTVIDSRRMNARLAQLGETRR